MKTILLKYGKLVLMALLLVNLTSCEVRIDEFYDDDHIGGSYYNRSQELCSRTWVSTYRNVDGNYCVQELDFYLDRTGVDYLRIEYPNGSYDEFEYYFTWNWDNSAQTSLRMKYGPKDVSYLDGIYLGGNRLSGYLDGRNNFVEYIGKR